MRHPGQTSIVVCITYNGAEDLEVRKVYQRIPDEQAALLGFVRVIDESGEDYLYPAAYFAPVELSDAATQALFAAPGG